MTKPSTMAILAMLGSTFCWATATTMSKGLLQYLNPMSLLLIQLLSSVGFLWLLELCFLKQRFALFSKSSTLGILEPGVAYWLNLCGLAHSSASHASFLGAIEPLFVLPIASYFLRERLSFKALLWTMVGTIGVLVIVFGESGTQTRGSIFGDVLIGAGMLSAAWYVVLSKYISSSLPALVLARQQQLCGLFFVLTISYWAEPALFHSMSSTHIPLGILVACILSGIVQYALAFWLYMFAIKHLSANSAASFLNCIPLFGTISATLFLGESIYLSTAIGGLLTVVGVKGVQRANM